MQRGTTTSPWRKSLFPRTRESPKQPPRTSRPLIRVRLAGWVALLSNVRRFSVFIVVAFLFFKLFTLVSFTFFLSHFLRLSRSQVFFASLPILSCSHPPPLAFLFIFPCRLLCVSFSKMGSVEYGLLPVLQRLGVAQAYTVSIVCHWSVSLSRSSLARFHGFDKYILARIGKHRFGMFSAKSTKRSVFQRFDVFKIFRCVQSDYITSSLL